METETSRETKTAAFWGVWAYVASVIAIGTFMSHFWWSLSVASYVLWGISGAFAIMSIYGGIITRATITEENHRKGMATAAAVIGCLVLLGLTISAVMLLVPLSLSPLR